MKISVDKIPLEELSNKSRDSSAMRGAGWLTTIVFVALFSAVGYSAYKIIPFYYYYFEIQNQIEAAVRLAPTETDQEIRKRLMYQVGKCELPIDPKDLKIVRDDGKLKISLSYDEIFYITFRGKDHDLHKFHFDVYAEGPL